MDVEERPDPLLTTVSQVAVIELIFIALALIAGRLIPFIGVSTYGAVLIITGLVAWMIAISRTGRSTKPHLGYRQSALGTPTELPVIDLPETDHDTSGLFMVSMFAVGIVNILMGAALILLWG